MKDLSPLEILEIWEESWDQPVLDRVLLLLALAYSFSDKKGADKLSLGERDARLLKLRESFFGSCLQNIAICPHCSAQVEWEMEVKDLQVRMPLDINDPQIFQLSAGRHHVQFRLPNSEDISSISDGASLRDILGRCVLSAQNENNDEPPDQLPDYIWEALDIQMAKEDPQANISLQLNCPQCGQTWEAPFDIPSYVWSEVDHWVHRLLREVYTLARAFHWSEKDILQMGPRRRRLYLEILNS